MIFTALEASLIVLFSFAAVLFTGIKQVQLVEHSPITHHHVAQQYLFRFIRMTFLSFFFCRFDPLHQRDEREHSPTGRLAVREDHQHQLGGRVQVTYHHTPPHGLWERGETRQQKLD